jgi:hypothetical protein
LGGLFASASAVPAHAVTLPEDKAETLVHRYSGGGVVADGPAILVRKRVADQVSLSGQLYVDMVSNASVDVVTTASPFRETRKAWELGSVAVVRDSTLSLNLSRSSEPDYQADAFSLDVASETFGGMTTVSLGFTRGADQVGKKGVTGWIDQALHWQYRAGITQVLSPRWLVSLNAETVADSGLLGSPYRVARVFGAAVPERTPRTRGSRALKLRSLTDTSDWLAGSSLRAEVRSYQDNWSVRATTFELGLAKTLPRGLLLDASLRSHRQGQALFYNDNAPSETRYLSRSRQLSAYTSTGLGARISYTWPGLPSGYGLALSAGYERKRSRYPDFTDLRTQRPYAEDANVFQAGLSATF